MPATPRKHGTRVWWMTGKKFHDSVLVNSGFRYVDGHDEADPICQIDGEAIVCPRAFESSQSHQKATIFGPDTIETDDNRGMLIGREAPHDSQVDYQVLLSYAPSMPKGLGRELMPDDVSHQQRGTTLGSKAWLATAIRRPCFPMPTKQSLARSVIERLSARRPYTRDDGVSGT
eukprot:3811559-Pyramimonas_sp.AAC.2